MWDKASFGLFVLCIGRHSVQSESFVYSYSRVGIIVLLKSHCHPCYLHEEKKRVDVNICVESTVSDRTLMLAILLTLLKHKFSNCEMIMCT